MKYEEFKRYRERMNARILSEGSIHTRRFFSLDTAVYRDGKLPSKTKELMGLVASTVLRCNDCIAYHVDRCIREGFTDDEIYEALDVALIVGGSITIPHIRYAYELVEDIRKSMD
ncbi:MAG: carboxymuconolactone decarboxylase family protein [Thermoplasmata archaeon]|nr:MAG: carboxymuconolactone decarboxylase family protein [Thermoplasmata archaeon]HHH77848.1 carboxymuconolactone decarboxylase family protein [Thermoplasmatales archaeon]